MLKCGKHLRIMISVMNKTYFLILWILVLYIYQGLPCGSEVKASASNVGDPGSIPGLGWSPGERYIYIYIYIYIYRERALVTQMVKNLPEVNSREYEKYF